MMVQCEEKLLAILRDENAPYWDKAEAEHFLRENVATTDFDWWLKYALKHGVR